MLLGFKPRFKEPILIGTKVFTMRDQRKIEPKIGETMHMYTGLRTSKCELISKKEKLYSTQQAFIEIKFINDILMYLIIDVDGRKLSMNEINTFVKYDGFNDWRDFCKYWISGYKYPKNQVNEIYERKTIYHWTDLKI